MLQSINRSCFRDSDSSVEQKGCHTLNKSVNHVKRCVLCVSSAIRRCSTGTNVAFSPPCRSPCTDTTYAVSQSFVRHSIHRSS
jgi:hypothetical protein